MDMALRPIVMPMFLFSGIFFPWRNCRRPAVVPAGGAALPRNVELLRALTTGTVTPVIAWHSAGCLRLVWLPSPSRWSPRTGAHHNAREFSSTGSHPDRCQPSTSITTRSTPDLMPPL